MDFLNKTFAQLTDLFNSMTPGARITTGLLLAVVVISLGYLFNYQTSAVDTDLMHGVPVAITHLAAMEGAFGKAGLNSYEIRGTSIVVPRGQRDVYMAALADANALPPNMENVLDKALEATSVFMGKPEREQRQKNLKQKALGLIIGQMKGIQSANVIFDSQNKPGFRKERMVTATASVKPLGNEELDQTQVSSIRHLVAGAIAGLKANQVTVADLNGKTHQASNSPDGGSADDNLYVKLKETHEQNFKAKISETLSYVKGIVVSLNVELGHDRSESIKTIKHDTKAVAVSEVSSEKTRSVESAAPLGRPGVASQQPNAPAVLAMQSNGSSETEDNTDRETISIPNTTQTNTQSVGPTPTKVAVSISVPSSYCEKIWLKNNPTEEGQDPQTPDEAAIKTIFAEESTKIQELVAGIIPAPKDGSAPSELVTVKMFQRIPGEEIPEPGFSAAAVGWFGRHWSTLGMLGLAAFSLVMLRSMIGAVPAGPRPAGTVVHVEGEEDEEPETVAMKRLKRFSGGGPNLRDELSDLVKEDTDAAANILRTWIGNAG